MSDISVIEINDDADKIEVDKIEVDKNDDKIFTFDNELHNGKPITRIEISPNEKYLITYSKKDCSIVGWNVKDIDKVQLKFDQTVKIKKDGKYEIKNLCVSDDKKLAYINYDSHVYKINIIDMNNKDKKIALSFDTKVDPIYCTFNLKGEFILYSEVGTYFECHYIIWIYSTKTKNNKWEYKEIKYCWNSKYKKFQLYFDEPIDESTDEQTKFVFGILNERVWKSKFYENMSKTKVIECETYKHLNVHSFNPYMDTVSTLFQQNTYVCKNKLTESIENLIKWEIYGDEKIIRLEVFKKINTEWELISTRIENHPCASHCYDGGLIASSLFNNNDIVILIRFGILIYTFSENNKSISLNYFYFKNVYYFSDCKKIFSESTLPLPNYDSFRLNGWVSDVKNNKSSLLKYGVELLTFAIKEHKLELIDDIYKKCMTYFKEDPMNNKSFLSIITSAMPLLDEYYPEYILKYSSETNMIIDVSFYSIGHKNKNFHLYSFFQSPQIANLSKSLLWTKYYYKFYKLYRTTKKTNLFILLIIYYAIQVLILLLTLPLYLATFYILSKYNFINDIYASDVFSIAYFLAVEIFKDFQKDIITTPTITFMIPYINFVNYSKDYNWFLELIRPQPSPFTKTINRNIYKTWNGEALINFKWNAYGKYYYAMIWILFMALLGCFTAAATIPKQYINEEVRQQLFIVSIIFGFIHLILEIRQFFYNITKWFYNFWNIFGK
ncbi:hypothetical protein RhiirC2_819457 [Rhizophagus irregularis]|uniref:Ion transport domain-containing protein n=1 Tax=Rhizophagus irregularis TaxID=588596 RepID=A0A2N1MEJ9_9GLOM|nr:hypothetical protein RhiirC2_819457 [Rhizophagus irregularis]